MISRSRAEVRHRSAVTGHAPPRLVPGDFPLIRQALEDVSWLLGRGYDRAPSLKLVAHKYGLGPLQRAVIQEAAASQASIRYRILHHTVPARLSGKPIYMDGKHLLHVLQHALQGDFIFEAPDGCCRSARKASSLLASTPLGERCMDLVCELLNTCDTGPATWVFSRTLRGVRSVQSLVESRAQKAGRKDVVLLSEAPDQMLAQATCPVATCHGSILDQVSVWTNIPLAIMKDSIPSARLIHLSSC
jgi:hypothetical protein